MHSCGCFEDDGAASSASWRWGVNNSATAWMRRYSAAGVLASEFHLNSFLSNGFRITYNATNDARADIYNYLVVWGTDWTVNSGTFNARTTVGSDTIAHGLGAAPNFVMQISGQRAADNDNGAAGQVAMGMASSTTVANQRCMAIAVENGRVTMDTWRYMPVDQAFAIIDGPTGAIDGICTISTLDATNFVDNWSDACSSAWRVSWLAIKGGNHNVHGMTAPAVTGNQSKTGLSYLPSGIFAFTRGATATTTSDAHARIAVGAAKSSSIMRGGLYGSEDNTANAEALVRSFSAYLIESNPADVAATASSTVAPELRIKLSTLNSDGYTWTYDSTVTNYISAVWAFSQITSTAYNGTPATEVVDVSSSVSRALASARGPALQSTTVSDVSLTRSFGAVRAPTTEVVSSPGGSVTGVLAADRIITEPDVQISENVVRSPILNRTITDQPQDISDSVAVNISVSRTVATEVIAEPTGTASRLLAASRAPPTETVNVGLQGNFLIENFLPANFLIPGDSISTQVGLSGAITEADIAISDSVSVTKTFNRTITEAATDIGEAIAQASGFFRTVATEIITIADMVTRGEVLRAARHALNAARRSHTDGNIRTSKRSGKGNVASRESDGI